MASAAIGAVFLPDTAEAAQEPWRTVADRLHERLSELGALMD